MTEIERLQFALIQAMRAATPEDESPRLILSDFLLEHVPEATWAVEALRGGRVPLTGIDEHAVALLANCRFLPGSFDKRFAADVHSLAARPQATLTPKQYWCLWRMVYRYRRQIKNIRINDIAERATNDRPRRDPGAPTQRELFDPTEVTT